MFTWTSTVIRDPEFVTYSYGSFLFLLYQTEIFQVMGIIFRQG